jgi:hypothetical protein
MADQGEKQVVDCLRIKRGHSSPWTVPATAPLPRLRALLLGTPRGGLVEASADNGAGSAGNRLLAPRDARFEHGVRRTGRCRRTRTGYALACATTTTRRRPWTVLPRSRTWMGAIRARLRDEASCALEASKLRQGYRHDGPWMRASAGTDGSNVCLACIRHPVWLAPTCALAVSDTRYGGSQTAPWAIRTPLSDAPMFRLGHARAMERVPP